MIRFPIALAMLALCFTHPAAAEDSIEENAVPQSAVAEDMALFEPYIGLFRSQDYTRQSDGARFHFTIDYSWYDVAKSIVAYRIEMVIEGDDMVREIGEGFYFFDRIESRIGVIGMFRDGRSGRGHMGEFDRRTHARTVWVTGTSPRQPPIEVRDSFELIDENSWRNVTRISSGGEAAEWRVISDSVYTRIEQN